MSKKVHYQHGCVWASGNIQQADTSTTKDTSKVTCKHCINNLRLLRWNKNKKEK